MKKKYIIVIVLALIVASAAIWYLFFKPSGIEYRLHEVKKGDITLKVLATGSVQPQNRLQIKSPIAGRADRVLVEEGQKVVKGQILAWISSSERAVLLDSARAQGVEEVKRWEEIYKPTPVIAPLNGTIILRSIEPGQTFTTSDAILVMADRLLISTQVDETDLAQIQLKQRAKVVLDAYPDKEFEASVSQISYEARTVNNVTTYIVEVLTDDKIEFLRSGMTANVTFLGESREGIVIIPNEFIKYTSGKPKAVIKVDGKNEERDIELGITDGKKTEIKSGVSENETVVLEIKKDTKSKSNLFSGPQQQKGGSRR